MNIVRFEIKRQWKSILVWMIGIGSILYLIYGLIWPAYQTGTEEIKAILSNFPKEFMKAIGLDITSMLSFEGFLNFGYTYMSLVGAIFASGLTIAVFGREKKVKCTEFLFTKPLKKNRIFLSKGIVCFVGMALMAVFHGSIVVLLYAQEGTQALTLGSAWYLAGPFFLNEVIFFSFGLLYTLFAKKIRSIPGCAILFGMGAFTLSAMANLLEKDFFLVLAPLKYFEVTKDASGNQEFLWTAGVGICLIAVCLVVGIRRYNTCEVCNN